MLAPHDTHSLLWQPVVMEPVPTLDALRLTVLAINPKRCPKWRFRVEAEVVLQLQPRPDDYWNSRSLFLGTVIEGQGITKDHFANKHARAGLGFIVLEFGIRDGARVEYEWQAGRQVPRDVYPGRWKVQLMNAPVFRDPEMGERALALKDQLIAALGRLHQLKPDMMFHPACLLCGKRLTDPVSMARWIGPECAYSRALDVGLFTRLLTNTRLGDGA
jgi:hypothetical protein